MPGERINKRSHKHNLIMKTFRKLTGMILAFLILAVTTSCSDDKDNDKDTPSEGLIGTWVEKTSVMPFTLVLKSDNTGYITFDTSSRAVLTDYFDWSETTYNGEPVLNVIHTKGDVIIESVINPYVLAGNELIIISSIMESTTQWNFTRKK